MDYPEKSYYDTLGIPRTATFEQIKSAYREQIKFFHPDVFNGSPEIAQQKSQELNEAYHILSNPVERDKYDFWLRVKDYQKNYARRKEEQHRGTETDCQSEQAEEQPKSSDPPPNESAEENRQEQNESDETTQTQDEAEQVKHSPTYKVACIVLLLVLVGVSAFSIWDIYGLQQQLDKANDTLAQELNRSAENGNHGMRAVDIMPRLSGAKNDDGELGCNGGETEIKISAYQSQQGNREKETAELNEQIEQLNREVSILTTDKEALANRIASLENALEVTQRELDGAQQELEDTLLKAQATDNYGFEMFQQLYKIGFIVNGSNYYHLFTCSIYKDASTYWAHNIEYCESLGYSKCPLCWNVS